MEREPASFNVSTWPKRTRVENSSPSRTTHSAAVAPPAMARRTMSSARLRRSVFSSAHGQAVHLQGWNADSYGDRLSVFATGPDAFVEFQIVAHHGDAREHVRAIADQRGAFDGGGDVAVFDEIGLGGGEDEFSAGDVHLAATEVYGVHAMLDRTDDVFRIVLPRQHVGVGHARHGNVFVAFATTVAGVGHAHQAGRELIAQVSLQDAVLDEYGVLSGLAFVVHVERAPAPGHGAVVYHRAFFASYPLADQAGKG